MIGDLYGLVLMDIAVVDQMWMSEISGEWLWVLWSMIIKCVLMSLKTKLSRQNPTFRPFDDYVMTPCNLRVGFKRGKSFIFNELAMGLEPATC